MRPAVRCWGGEPDPHTKSNRHRGHMSCRDSDRDTGSPRTVSLRCTAHSPAGRGLQPDPSQLHSPCGPHPLLDAKPLVSASRTISFALTARPLTDPRRGQPPDCRVSPVSTHSSLHSTLPRGCLPSEASGTEPGTGTVSSPSLSEVAARGITEPHRVWAGQPTPL